MNPLYTPRRGWKDRQRSVADRAAIRAVDPEREEVRRVRAEMYAAEEEANRLAAEATERALADHLVSCPCCGSSDRPVTVDRAAAFLDAWDRYHLDGRKPDRKFVQAVSQTAWGREPASYLPRVRVSYGAFNVVSMGSLSGSGVVPVHPAPERETVEPVKPAKGTKSELKESRRPQSLTTDGFLIEED